MTRFPVPVVLRQPLSPLGRHVDAPGHVQGFMPLTLERQGPLRRKRAGPLEVYVPEGLIATLPCPCVTESWDSRTRSLLSSAGKAALPREAIP